MWTWDGNLDALTTDFEPSFTGAFGDGKGHFSGYIRPNTGNNCLSVELAVADLNGDGIPDIAGTCFADVNTPGKVFVLLGEGNRKFKKVMHFSSGGQEPYGIAVGDLNHDGIPDLVVANNGSQEGDATGMWRFYWAGVTVPSKGRHVTKPGKTRTNWC